MASPLQDNLNLSSARPLPDGVEAMQIQTATKTFLRPKFLIQCVMFSASELWDICLGKL